MDSAASLSASRRAGSRRPGAAPISEAGTAISFSSTLSNRAVYSRSALSPRVWTSSTIARTSATGAFTHEVRSWQGAAEVWSATTKVETFEHTSSVPVASGSIPLLVVLDRR